MMIAPRPIVYYENLANSKQPFVDQLMANKVSYILLADDVVKHDLIDLDHLQDASDEAQSEMARPVVEPSKDKPKSKAVKSKDQNSKKIPKITTGLGLSLDDILSEENRVASKENDHNYFG